MNTSSSSSDNAVASTSTAQPTDLWSDILRSTDRSNRVRGAPKRKNLVLLSERHHGRTYLLDQLLASSSSTKRRNRSAHSKSGFGGSLALGYEVLEVRDDGDEDSVPPISIFYPPSSHPSLLRLLPLSLPPKSMSDTGVVVVLDWTKPSSMAQELLSWLRWVEEWASASAQRGEAEDMREQLQSHLQNYAEPPVSTTTAGLSTSPTLSTLKAYTGGPLLPLGPGTLTLNTSGIPITVVCTKADLMDSVADELGMKSGWEERTDWIQQVLRTICLSYGAALFYTTPSQPSTFTLLRNYLLHRLFTTPPSLNPPADVPPPPLPTQFPFQHRANVLDRDSVVVPTGWDSWGKINVLRDGFDPGRVGKAWEASLRRAGSEEEKDVEGIEDLWMAVIPDTQRPTPFKTNAITDVAESEQSFLSRQLETLLKDPNRDPRASFRTAAAMTAASTAPDLSVGVVGPMGSGGLNLPGVEKAMMELEGGTVEDMKEKFARLGRRESMRDGSGLTSPLSPTGLGATSAASVPKNEALHNFNAAHPTVQFQGLLATKAKSSTVTPVATPSATNNSMAPPPVPTNRLPSPSADK